ncbi:hypothetical protein [Rhodopirellula bahusiensis]|uniref:hypothetical protein n=1 Tax=Rhodopirellula bahusiensis TaxID=2014065 RepID=UPI00326543DF
MAGIGELSVSITARTQKAVANIRNFRKSVNTLPAVIGKASTGLAGLAATVASIAGVSTIGNEIRKSFDNIDGLAKTSDKLGIATEKLSALRFAAEENGVAATTTDMALQRMVRRVAEAAQGTGEAVGALDELGLSAARLASMSPDQQFYAIADSMASVTNQGDRVRLSMKLFDSEGVALVNTLRLGSQGLKQYEAEAKRLGITVSRVDAAQIEKANDAFGRIGKVVEGVTNGIAIGLAPAIEGLSNGTAEWGASFEVTGDSVLNKIQGIAKAQALLLDGVSFWVRSFKSAKAYLTELLAWAMKKFAELDSWIVKVLNRIPTMNLKEMPFVQAMADEMENAAKAARAAADEAWSKGSHWNSVDAMFDKIRSNIEAARKEMETEGKGGFWALIGQKAGAAKGQLSGIPQMLASGISKAETFLGKGANGPFNAMTSGVMSMFKDAASLFEVSAARTQQSRANPGILNARSAEGYAALRSSMNGGGVQTKILEAQKAETKQTAKVVTAITELANKIIPTETVGFDS